MQAERIVNIKPLGLKRTIDITVDSEEHLFYGNGIATSNSHSVSYAVNAYYSAYCKCHNLTKFYEVYLNHAHKKPESLEEISELVNDARLHNVEILNPSLEHFYKDCKTVGDKIYFGVAHVKGVGEKEVIKLFNAVTKSVKKFQDLTWPDLLLLLGKGINKTAFKSLVSVGAFRGRMNINSRTRMLYEYDICRKLTTREMQFIVDNYDPAKNLEYHVHYLANNAKIAASRLKTVLSCLKILSNPLYSMDDNPRWVAQTEKSLMGISLSCSATDDVDISTVDTTCKDIRNGSVNDKTMTNIAVELVSFREHKIKKAGKNFDKTMAWLTVQDGSGQLNSVTMFPDQFEVYKDLLFDNNTLLINGTVESRNGEKSLIVEKVFQI